MRRSFPSRRLALLGALLAWPAARSAGASDAPASPPEAAPAWSFTVSAFGFLVPDARDLLNPNATADRGGLHLEARYNYEAFEAGSAWIGWNLAAGEALVLGVTPMLGAVFGSIDGVAPGWLLSLEYREVSLFSQGEYFIDASDTAGSFLYVWSELSWAPVEWFRTGVAVQRTKAYETSLDVQRGVLAGLSYRAVEVAGYVFDLGWTDPTVVIAVTASF